MIKAYPSKDWRNNRLKEISDILDVLSVNREELNRQINILLLEQKLLQDLELLEKFINKEVNIEFRQSDVQQGG